MLSNLNNFHSLEVVDRVSETQLQVGENSNWIIWRLKGWHFKCDKRLTIISHSTDLESHSKNFVKNKICHKSQNAFRPHHFQRPTTSSGWKILITYMVNLKLKLRKSWCLNTHFVPDNNRNHVNGFNLVIKRIKNDYSRAQSSSPQQGSTPRGVKPCCREDELSRLIILLTSQNKTSTLSNKWECYLKRSHKSQ